MTKPRQSIRTVPLDRIEAHPGNIRKNLGDLTELALSIREHGILQPLIGTDAPNGWVLLLAGHRRAAAARKAGLTAVPVIIRHGLNIDETEQTVVMLVENCQRTDLNPMERAEAFGVLHDQGLTHADIARRTGLSQMTVTRSLALLKLPAAEQAEIRDGHLAASRALGMAVAERQEARVRAAGRPKGRPKGAKSKPYFGPDHPLAADVRRLCNHRGRAKVGTVGCGPCWEHAIRTNEEEPTSV